MNTNHMQDDNNVPTLNCIIIGEINNETYNVEIVCPGGGTHTHGLPKTEVGMKSHRVDHCENCKHGYDLYLSKDEVSVWDKYKKNK